MPFQLEGTGVQTYSFTGSVSGQSCTGRVWFPSDYDPAAATTYPIILAMHGKGGTSSTTNSQFIPELEDAIAAAQIRKCIVVMPDANIDWGTDSFDGTSKGETKIIDDVIPYFLLHTRSNGTVVGTGFSMGGWSITVLAMRNIGRFAAVWGCGCPNMDSNPVSGNANNWRWVNSVFSDLGANDTDDVQVIWGPTGTGGEQTTTLAALTAASPLATATGGALANLNSAAIISGLPLMYCKSAADAVSLTSLNAMTTGYSALSIPHIFVDLATPVHSATTFYAAAQATSSVGAGNGFMWFENAFAGAALQPPVFLGAAINAAGTSVTLTYSKNLDTGSTPATTDLALTGTHATVNAVVVTGATVVLTFPTAIKITDFEVVTVAYTPGTNKIRDAAGNPAIALPATTATNNSTFLAGALGWFDLAHTAGAATLSSASLTAGSDLQNAAWTKTEMTATAATTATVNAAATAPAITQTVTNAAAEATRNVTMGISATTAFVDIQWVVFETRSGTATSRTWFDIQNGVVGTTGSDHQNPTISAAVGGRRTVTLEMWRNGGTAIVSVRPVTVDGALTTVLAGTTLDITAITATQVRASSVPCMNNATTWVQATVLNQPAYEATAGPNSKPRILGSQVAAVNSTNVRTLFNTDATIPGGLDGDDAAVTVFLVASGYGDATGALFGVGDSAAATAGSWYFGTNNAGAGRNTTVKNDGGATGAVSSADMVASPAVLEWFGSGQVMSCRENGAAANPSAAAFNAGSIAPNRSALLSRGSSTALHGQGAISAGVMFGSELSSGDRSDIRQYWGAIFAITVTP